MSAAALKRKVVVTGLGLVLALVLLEAALYGGRQAVDLVREREALSSLGAPGEFRILCLGDSTTELGGDEAWPGQLQVVLQQAAPRRPYRVINGGQTCADTGYVAAHLQQNLDRYRPQLVVMMVGINEHGIRMYRQLPTSSSLLFKHSRTYRLLVLMLWRALGGDTDRTPDPGPMYREPYTRRNMESMARTLRSRGIRLVAMQYPRRPAAPLSELLRGLQDVVVVSNQAAFEGALEGGRYEDYFMDRFAGDFGHCTPKGNRLLAENLARTLRRGEVIP